MKRVLFYAPYSAPIDALIVELLIAAGWEVRYLCTGQRLRTGIPVQTLEHQPLPEIHWGTSKLAKVRGALRSRKRVGEKAKILQRSYQAFNPKLVIVSDFELGVPAALRAGVGPILGLSQGSDVYEVPERDGKQSLAIRSALEAVEGVIALSNSHADRVRELNPMARVTPLPPMVDCERFAPRPRPQSDMPRLLSLRGERKVYRQDIIKAAFALLDEELALELRIRLTPNWIHENWAKAITRGRVSAVLADIDPLAMPAEYTQASIVLQMLRNESLGLTTLEAMASGRAIVGVDSTIHRELLPVTQQRWLVPARLETHDAARSTADLVKELISAPNLLAELEAANRAHALEHFSASKVRPKAQLVLSEALDGI
ncbi:MAG: glycosyltransferase family 4 protein [Planctomycetes bacterium]|nr:glycosyltransferase family 4 protein [Planctomycetota bacterium]